MCHAPVALDVTAAIFVPDTEGVLVSLTGVGIHRDVIDEFETRVHLLACYNSLLKLLLHLISSLHNITVPEFSNTISGFLVVVSQYCCVLVFMIDTWTYLGWL